MAISMAVFGGDAFERATMIRALDRRPYVPMMLDRIINFEVVPVSTPYVYVSTRRRYVNLIRTTLRGAPIEMQTPEDGDARPLKIHRLGKGDTLFAHQLNYINPLEGETEEQRAAILIREKQERLINDYEATLEYHRLGALRGLVLDTDGSTLVNFWTEFGLTQPADIDLNLDASTPLSLSQLRQNIASLITIPIQKASGAGNDPRFRFRAVCGDAFWFALTGHPSIERAYELDQQARSRMDENIWDSFRFAGIEWFHYRGTDDGSAIAVEANKAHIFPTGVPGMWQHVMGPMDEDFRFVGQPGRRYYTVLERDKSDKQQWVMPEIYGYPLIVNSRPDLVLTATV